MSTKLSFRARALDPSKPMPIYFAEELPDLQEYSAINRAVPQMPSGMEKEEESEHHLQRAIIAGLIIPTPDVIDVKDDGFYDKNYPADYKMPRQLIHVQPLSLEQDIPDYDMDSADEMWVESQNRLDLTPFKFEQMMDRLEKNTGQTVITLNEAKALLKQNDEVSVAVFDYWLNKRLKTKHPLLLSVKTESRGNSTSNNPYIAFRRRTEKMQTRKNRKNDETSYEKMLKLRRDLSRAVKLLEMVKRREKTKREELQLNIEIYEKRYQAKDFSGQLLAEYTSSATKSRPAFAPLYPNQYHHQHSTNLASSQHNQWNSSSQHYGTLHHNHHHLQNNKRDLDGMSTSSSRKEKRQYKKRKHKAPREKPIETYDGFFSSDEEDIHNQMVASESEDDGSAYPFRRNKNCDYYKPQTDSFGNWPWESREENGAADPKYRFTLTSLRHPTPRCIGFARRRMGRGGRIILDRASTCLDDVWSKLDYTIFDNVTAIKAPQEIVNPPITTTPIETKQMDEINQETSAADNNDAEMTLVNQNSMKMIPTSVSNHHNNIVIKSENSIKLEKCGGDQMDIAKSSHSCSVNNQKLDDFEQLLDSANASSNIINKNLVCKNNNSDISNDSFNLKSANNISHSEMLIKNSSVGVLNSFTCETVSSGISISTNGSTSFALNRTLSQNKDITAVDSGIVADTASTLSSSDNVRTFEDGPATVEDIYMDLLDEIRSDCWLHFRPKTPPMPSDDILFDSDLMNDTKFAVELQMLNDGQNETEKHSCTDNLYLSQPLSFNYCNRSIHSASTTGPQTAVVEESTPDLITIKPEPMDGDWSMDIDSGVETSNEKMTKERDVIRTLVEKCQNDKEDYLELDMEDLDFTDLLSDQNESIGCSSFKLTSEDLAKMQPIKPEINVSDKNDLDVEVKKEMSGFPITNQIVGNSDGIVAPIKNVIKEAPIAELQTHNYVLQYGSPVSSSSITINAPSNANLITTNPNGSQNIVVSTAGTSMTSTLFQQQFINSGNAIISTSSQGQQNKLPQIVYDSSNTIVLAAPNARKQLNGPVDRNLNQNKYKQVFMLDLSQGQDKRKQIGTLTESGMIKKSYSELGLGSQNILVSSVNPNMMTANHNNMNQQPQTQQFSLVHQNTLQKPIILSTSTSGGAGTLLQSSQTGTTGNKIIVTPAPGQLTGNVYVSTTHGKLVLPSSNNQQSIILDSSKMITTTGNQVSTQVQNQQKLQPTHQHRVKMENKMNMLLESSGGEKNIIYAKYNKNKLLHTVANFIPVHATNKNNIQAQSSTTKQLQPITTTSQPIGIISNNKSIQRIQTASMIQQQQNQFLRQGTTSVNFQNSPTTSKLIQQPNNGNNLMGSVGNNDNNSAQNNSSPR